MRSVSLYSAMISNNTMPGLTRSPVLTASLFNNPLSGDATGIFIFIASSTITTWPVSIFGGFNFVDNARNFGFHFRHNNFLFDIFNRDMF